MPSGSPALWYGNFYPPDGSVSRFFKAKNDVPIYQLQHYPGWRQCHYLPLMTASGSATGLTVYMRGPTIYGIASHGVGPSSHLVGRCNGVAVHFALNEGEYLTSAWLQEFVINSDVQRDLAVESPYQVPFQLNRKRDFRVC